VRAFLHRNRGLPIAGRLRGRWLEQLAKARRWSEFLQFWDGRRDVELRCVALRARWRVGRHAGVLDAARDLWLSGHSRPDSCDPLFALLRQHGRITATMLWQRITLAMGAGNLSLADYLAGGLGAADRRTVRLWRRVYRDPAAHLRDPRLARDSGIHREIVLQGLRRLARGDAAAAHDLWQRLRDRYRFSAGARNRLERRMALAAARQGLAQARPWLDALAPAAVNGTVRRRRVLLSLAAGDWHGVLKRIAAMHRGERDDERWRYWRARALEALGRRHEADALYASLPRGVDYYAFLASDHLGRPYRLKSKPLVKDDHGIKVVARLEGIRRAHELRWFGRNIEARREWVWATRRLKGKRLKLAALLADRWGWHSMAIITTAQTRQWGDLELRFPMPYRQAVLKGAQRHHLDPSWVYAVARRESAFVEDARSGVGALGLMQLMPHTAREVSRSLGLARPQPRDLLEPERNIRLGTGYLRRMLDRFGGNEVLATAAYNAGPNRVQAWLPDKGRVAPDVWIEQIPFRETRDYVRAVLAYATVFDWKLHGKPKPVSQRMPPVQR